MDRFAVSPDGAGGMTEAFEGRLVDLLFQLARCESHASPNVHHFASSNVNVSRLVN